MTVFLDTNVLIDFLTARGSFGPNVIVTRDKDGFVNATIPVMTPVEFLLKFSKVP